MHQIRKQTLFLLNFPGQKYYIQQAPQNSNCGNFFNGNPTSTPTANRDDCSGDNAKTGPEEKYEPNDHQQRSAEDITAINYIHNWLLQPFTQNY